MVPSTMDNPLSRIVRSRPACSGAWLIALALLLAPACGGGEPPGQPPPAPEAPAAPAPPALAPAPPAPVLEMLAIDGTEESTLAALGAIPAWEAVVARARYLGRRDQAGVVVGRLGGASDGHGRDARWLVDETEGAGALAIRVVVDDRLELAEGQRLVAWGAWWVDDAQRWYWKADRVAGLAPRGDGVPAGDAAMPGLDIAMIPAPPEGAEPVSQRTTPGDILFQVRAVPAEPTDGWEIADRSSDEPVARLLLPGERPSYGAQDYRSPDEHWRLERGVPYVVRVKRFRPSRDGEPILMRAVDAPRRIAP